MEPSIFSELATAGSTLHSILLEAATAPDKRKSTPDFGIGRLAALIGVSSNHIRNLEKAGSLPPPRTVDSGATHRRAYNLAEADHIRRKLALPRGRPDGTRALRISFSNLKGGVGKSTTSVHFAQYAARQGYRVLLVDMDPQASATSSFGYIPDLHLSMEDSIHDAIMDDPDAIQDIIRQSYWHNLDLIPAQLDLQAVDFLLPLQMEKEHTEIGVGHLRLRQALEIVRDDYDLIIIDTPPSLGMLCFNSFLAADYIVTPLQPQMYDLASSVQFFRILASVLNKDSDSPVRKLNLLVNCHDQSKESTRSHSMLLKAYGAYVLTNYLPLTKEVQKAANDLVSIYEISEPRGSVETHRNAIRMFNLVNEEILTNCRLLWQEEVDLKKPKMEVAN